MSATELIMKYSGMNKVRPVHLDGFFLVGAAVSGSFVATFSSDAAYKYLNAELLFVLKTISEAALAGFTALVTYRNKSYAHDQDNGSTIPPDRSADNKSSANIADIGKPDQKSLT